MYIKALEQEVLRLKETYGGVIRDRDLYMEENRRLRELLAMHNIAFPDPIHTPVSGAVSSSGSISGSYAAPSSYAGAQSPPPMAYAQHGHSAASPSKSQPIPSNGINYDQIGIDFVLTYDQSPYLSPPPGL